MSKLREGATLSSLLLPVTLRRCVILAAATRDFYPGHHDPAFARAQGVGEVYVSTIFLHGVIDRVAMETLPPDAALSRRRMTMHQPVRVGETIEGTGQITSITEDGGFRTLEIDVELHTERGLATTATLTITLPRPAPPAPPVASR